jgi:hypothetical protein
MRSPPRTAIVSRLRTHCQLRATRVEIMNVSCYLNDIARAARSVAVTVRPSHQLAKAERSALSMRRRDASQRPAARSNHLLAVAPRAAAAGPRVCGDGTALPGPTGPRSRCHPPNAPPPPPPLTSPHNPPPSTYPPLFLRPEDTRPRTSPPPPQLFLPTPAPHSLVDQSAPRGGIASQTSSATPPPTATPAR